MLKQLFLVFSSLVLLISTGLDAQTITQNKTLAVSAQSFRLAENENYAKALRLAKQNNWPLVITGRNNSRGTLVGVDFFGFPKYYFTHNNIIAATTTGADKLWPGGSTGLNLSGSSASLKNKLGIWDGGSPLTTHVELNGRVTVKDGAAVDDHATHTTGTLMATGVNPVAKGMAFGLQGIVSYDYTNDISEMFGEAGNNILLSNHSYGVLAGWVYNSSQSRWEFYGEPGATEDYKFGYYSSDAQSLDSLAYNAPYYLIVKAAGNNRNQNGPPVDSPYYRFNSSGVMASAGNRPAGISSNNSYGIISWDANAKNILTIGAVSGIPAGYSAPADVLMSDFSSWGPTDDGRIKPDLVADGINVTSSIAASNTAYATYSGTSMSTPNVTGSLLLLQEYYNKLRPGQFLRSATLKGLAIHTADEAGPAQGPDYQFGWGLLDVARAAAVITAAVPSNNAASSQHLLYENNLINGKTDSITVVASGSGSLIATICWTDVKGSVDNVNVLNNPAKKLVNDLDLRISKGGSVYLPWILDPANPANPATRGDNITDNVERVEVDSVVPGQTYTIKISHKGTLARGAQAYSLLVSGVGGNAVCASAASSNAGSRIDSVSFAGIQKANPAGCTTYTDYTGITGKIQPNQTLPLTVKVSNCSGGALASTIVKVFIDYNGNGQFTDAGELAATTGDLSTAGGIFTGSVSVPGGLAIGNYILMRVVAVQTSNPASINPCGSYPNGETQDYRLKIIQPSNDLALQGIIAPLTGDCSNPNQLVAVNIQNKGSVDIVNPQVTAVIKNGAATVATLNATYPGTIPAGGLIAYTFQQPFASTDGSTYSITAYVSAGVDQNHGNDTISGSVTISAKPATPAGTANNCGSSVTLKVTNPDASTAYFWYDTPTATQPLASGASTSTSVITSNKTYYLGTGARASVGLTSKNVAPAGPGAGGYINLSAGVVYVNFTAATDLILESAKLYTGSAGTVTLTVADITPGSGGSFSYLPYTSVTFDVSASDPTPLTAPISPNPTKPINAGDSGNVYILGLPLPKGSHSIIISTDANSSVGYSNNVTGSPYPFSATNIFSLTSNSITDPSTTNPNPNYFQSFYLGLYDLKLKTGSCISDRAPIVATVGVAPVISQAGDSLVSSIASGNQWYFNNLPISGATGSSYKPTQSGFYSVIVTAGGCSLGSNSINFTVTAVVDVNGSEIGLVVSPNPSNGQFNVQFEVKLRDDLKIEVLNMLGQNIYSKTYTGFSGRYNDQLNLGKVSSGAYILKIWHNNKLYLKKIMVRR
jgi:hypothetical protein